MGSPDSWLHCCFVELIAPKLPISGLPVTWDNKHPLFKPFLVRCSFTCRGKHLNWYRTLSIQWTKSIQNDSKKTDIGVGGVAHPLAHGTKKPTGSASFRLRWIKSPGLRFSPFSTVLPFLLASLSGGLSPHGKTWQLQACCPYSSSHAGKGGLLFPLLPPEVVGWSLTKWPPQNWTWSGAVLGVSKGCPSTRFLSLLMLRK